MYLDKDYTFVLISSIFYLMKPYYFNLENFVKSKWDDSAKTFYLDRFFWNLHFIHVVHYTTTMPASLLEALNTKDKSLRFSSVFLLECPCKVVEFKS